MALQEIMQHIYWDNVEIFPQGSQISIDHHYQVHWENRLMAPGREIITWQSEYNYQASKVVPQLPILSVNKHYCIISHLSSVPAKAYIARLVFRDLQGTVLQKYDFTDDCFDFNVPDGTVSYSLSIVNAGCYQLDFDRFDICPADMDASAGSDIWPHQPINTDYHVADNLILLADGQRSRKTYPELQNLTKLPVQLISVGWQSRQSLTRWLRDWLHTNQVKQPHIAVASPSLNMTALELTRAFPLTQLLLTTHIAGRSVESWGYQPVSWATSAIVEPDFAHLMRKMNQIWK